jgi:hypothetical protein
MAGVVRTVRQQVLCCAVAALALMGVASCTTGPTVTCAGQCAKPYELQVDFHPGTAPATAEHILSSCAVHNPVVIRIGRLEDRASGWRRALIFTTVFGNTPRTAGLLKCLRSAGVAEAGWPD